jgi:hypothetical protein
MRRTGMKRIFLTLLALAGLALAGVKTYTVNLLEPAMLGATELKAGQYQFQVDGDRVTVRGGKTAAEAPVKEESNGAKYKATTVKLSAHGGKQHIAEICLGGTTTRLVFSE